MEEERSVAIRRLIQYRNGCTWAFGPMQTRGSMEDFGEREFDEFVVYTTSQVRLRFLVEFEFVDMSTAK